VYYAGGASGSVTTAGTAVTWQGGTPFNANSGWVGLTITINSVAYVIASVASPTSLALTSSAGTQSSQVSYSMPSTAPAAIFSDNNGTTASNPFSASSTGYWGFYADNGTYDVKMSGGGIPSPFTWGAISVFDPVSLASNSLAYYGAKGDGTTNDAAAVNRAISSGQLYLEAACGTYYMGSSYMANIGVAGAILNYQWGCATFVWDAAYNGPQVTINFEGNAFGSKIAIGGVQKKADAWRTGGDVGSVGVTIKNTIGAEISIGMILYSWTGLLMTNSIADTTANTVTAFAYDNKINAHIQPVAPYGVNSNTLYGTYKMDSGFCNGASPYAGTYGLWFDSGSDNNNIGVNLNLEGDCVVYSAYFGSNGNTLEVPRFEANVAGAVTLKAGTFGNVIRGANTSSGVIAPTIVDLGSNAFISTATQTTMNCAGASAPALTVSDTTTVVFRAGCLTDAVYAAKQTIGTNAPTAPTAGLGIEGGLRVGPSAAAAPTNGVAVQGNITTDGTVITKSQYSTGTASITGGTCGTSPSITSSSSNFGGRVTVGTGGIATSCGVTFSESAPVRYFCAASNITAAKPVACSGSTNTISIYHADGSALTASEVIDYVTVMSKP